MSQVIPLSFQKRPVIYKLSFPETGSDTGSVLREAVSVMRRLKYSGRREWYSRQSGLCKIRLKDLYSLQHIRRPSFFDCSNSLCKPLLPCAADYFIIGFFVTQDSEKLIAENLSHML